MTGMVDLLVRMSDSLETIKTDNQPINGQCDKKEVPDIGQERVSCDLIEMLTENSGISMCDSGGAYGRHWQRNRLIKDWDDRPSVTLSAMEYTNHAGYKSFDIDIRIDLYQALNELLKIDEDTFKLRERFNNFAHSDEEKNNYWHETIENFVNEINDKTFYEEPFWHNTYEDENNELSQIIQFFSFEYEGDYYAFIEIHGGADIRGGYSDPYLFKVHYEDLILCGNVGRDDGDFIFKCPECGVQWIEKDYGTLYLEKEYDEAKSKIKSFESEQLTLEGEHINQGDVVSEIHKRVQVAKDIEIKENDTPYHKGCKEPLIYGYY
ncbi:MAG: hypothetical protein Q8N08_05700 [Methanobacteriaceae archaeon]|nr:hypothetical protein [Methanobacteriaceae archaeon]